MRQKIINAVWWSATRTGGDACVTFLVFLLLARLLDPKTFGLVAMATVFTELIVMFQGQGFDQAIVQRQDLKETHLDTAFWVSLLTGVLLTGCGIAIAGPVARLFGEPQVEPIVRWLALSFLFISFGSTQNAILRRSLQMKQLAVRSLSATVISGIVAVVMAISGFGVWSLVARSLISTLLESVAVWYLSDWRPHLRFSWSQFVELFTFGANIVGKRIITVVHHRADAFLIGFYLGPTLLGYYAVAYKLIQMAVNLLTNISGPVALPAFSRMQHDPDRLQRAFYEATRLTSVVAFPVFLGIAAVAPELVPALYGEQWVPSIPVLQALTLVGLLQTIFYYHTSVLVAAGKPSWNLGVKLVSTVCNVMVLLIAVRWGLVAVAVACVVSNYLTAPISLQAVQRCVPFTIRSYLQQCVVPLIASVCMFLAVHAFRQLPLHIPGLHGQLLLLVTVGAVVYPLVLHIVAPTQIAQIIELFRSIRPRTHET